jgi:serine/threonine-protein kinase HipA
LELAATLEIGAVRSRVLRFVDEVAIVVDRFDRQKRGSTYYRIHQEDCCQALGVIPTRKYENEGGPGVAAIILLLRDYSQRPSEDVDRFVAAVALNWILAATDGHAKNYALLHGARGTTRLAPFYDIASYLPYSENRLHRVKLAMKIGSEYLARRITRSDWEALARSAGIQPSRLVEQVQRVVDTVSVNVDQVREAALKEGLDGAFINQLADLIKQRTETCRDAVRPAVSTNPAA